ncbi:MAG: hypothetical protein ACRDQ2_12135 [Gaiellales bacterium]
MKRKNTRSKGRFFAVLAVAGLIGVATYAFTASNTVAASKAGDGAAGITGFDVTGVTYNLNALNPAIVDSYEFDLSAPANTVAAKLIAAQVTYDTCTNLVNHWTCTPPVGTTVTSVDNLRVIAAD